MSELRTNRIVPRDGLPSGSFGGGIVQVRFAAHDSSTTFTGNTNDILSLNITPTRSDSKILLDLRVRCQTYYSGSGDTWHWSVGRRIGGGTKIHVSGKGKLGAGTAAMDLGLYAFAVTSSQNDGHNPGVSAYIPDVPATTSQITYSVSLVAWGGATGSIRVNNRDHENDGIQLVAYELSG
mgnify:FL=1|tara:strand:- start:889 stop:1428 length:540 start_codon:yes stop_codon:yes gene_type:complete